MTILVALQWAFDHWSILVTVINAIGSLILFYAHLSNKSDLADVVQKLEGLIGQVQINPQSAQDQARLQDPKK